MARNIECGRRVRKDFGKIPSIVEIPNLIEIQQQSYEQFLQKEIAPERRDENGAAGGLQVGVPDRRTTTGTPRSSSTATTSAIPKYTVEECHDRGMTFAIPLKVTLRLKVVDNDKETKTQTVREVREQEVYLGELPLMTEKGTFIINGTERVVVSQLQRSAGVFFDDDKGKTVASGKLLFSARVIPYRGSWVEFEFDANDILYVRVDRRRKMLATAFLRAFWFLEKGVILSDEEILGQFYETEEVLSFEDRMAWVKLSAEVHNGAKVADDVKAPRGKEALVQAGKTLNPKIDREAGGGGRHQDPGQGRVAGGPPHRRAGGRLGDRRGAGRDEPGDHRDPARPDHGRGGWPPSSCWPWCRARPTRSLHETLSRDHFKNPDEALVEIYRRLRPGDPPTVESARALFRGMFLDPRRYDLARVGRFMINKKLGIGANLNIKTLRSEDVVYVVRHLFQVKLGSKPTDDIDHLGNRRVRSVGELLENQFRVGLTRMERAVKERMSISDITNLMPHDLINAKPVSAVVKEFFGSSQLSQFMDQTNPLAELTHKRRLSALGPRGLSRERAGFEVRDVHPTHYGRICPIETPEGPNIGLISSLSTYARINEFGFIETPYRKVEQGSVLPGRPGLPHRARGRALRHRAGQRVDERAGPLHAGPGVGPEGRRVQDGVAGGAALHRHLAQAAGVGGGRDGAVPRERRRQPGPHGRQHAAPGGAAAAAGGAAGRAPAWSTSWPATRGRWCSPSGRGWSSTCRPIASWCGRRRGPRRRIRSRTCRSTSTT